MKFHPMMILKRFSDLHASAHYFSHSISHFPTDISISDKIYLWKSTSTNKEAIFMFKFLKIHTGSFFMKDHTHHRIFNDPYNFNSLWTEIQFVWTVQWKNSTNKLTVRRICYQWYEHCK